MKRRDSIPPSPVIAVTDATFQEVVLESSKTMPVIVDFWASWCEPCRAFMPTFERHAQSLQGKVLFASMNVDDNPETTQAYNVRSIPQIHVFQNGKSTDAVTGAKNAEALIKSLLPK